MIPDPHDEPAVSKERFTWAGRLIVDRQPDAVVCLGDGATMDSLSEYDKGKKVAEGRRVKEDFASFQKALKALHDPIDSYNNTQTQYHKRKYNPEWIYNLGNHEQRILKAINNDPKMDGMFSLDNLKLQERGWQVYPLTVPVDVYGVAFAHYFTSGIMGKAISGINHARSLVAKTYKNTVVGHSHNRQFWEDTDIYGDKLTGIVAGCYFDHKLCYTSEEDRNWPGLLWLRVEDKQIDPEFISMDRIKRDYA